MRSRIVLLAVIGLGLGLTGQAKADIPPPLPPPKDAVTVKIEVDEKAKGPRLVVPNGVFTPPRARPLPGRGDAREELELEKTDGIGSHQWLIAGLALTLSMTFGGLWLRKRGLGSVRNLALLIAAGATLMIGAVVWGDIPPPRKNVPVPPVRKVPAPVVQYPSVFEGKASVEFIYGQEPIRLILDKESFEKLKKGELTLPPKSVPLPPR